MEKQELIELYSDYCEYIDNDNNHSSEHDYYKSSLKHFFEWLEKSYISDLN